jgi:hypothetical protein
MGFAGRSTHPTAERLVEMRPKSGNGGFPGRLVFPSRSCGNDFQQLRGNQRFRYFHLSTTSIPYGDQLALDMVRWLRP